MNKYWIYIIITAVFSVALIIGWQLFLTFSDYGGDLSYTQTQINPTIFDRVEGHFTSSQDFEDLK